MKKADILPGLRMECKHHPSFTLSLVPKYGEVYDFSKRPITDGRGAGKVKKETMTTGDDGKQRMVEPSLFDFPGR